MKAGYQFGYWCVLLLALGCDAGKKGVPGNIVPKVIVTNGYEVPQDSMAEPLIVPVDEKTFPKITAGTPVVVPVSTLARRAGLPSIVPVGSPRVCTPGQDAFLLPQTIPAIEVKEASLVPRIIEAKDMVIDDAGQVYFSYFGKLQGPTRAQSITQDHIGNLWFGYGGGATRYDGKTFTHFTLSHSSRYYAINSMLQDKDGNLWFGTDGKGIYKYNGTSFAHFPFVPGLARDNHIHCITQDRDGNLWFGTSREGVYRYDRKTLPDGQASFTRFTKAQGLAHNNVHSILEDTHGDLWFATGDGVSRYNGTAFANFNATQGLPSNIVTCILEDKYNNLWFGTDGGIVKYNGNSVPGDQASFTIFTDAQGLASNIIHSIVEDREGNLWFGTHEDGISKYDGNYVAADQATFTNFTEAQGLANNMVKRSLRDREGNLWFCTNEGVTKYNGNVFTHFTKAQGLTSNAVRSLLQDHNGYMWIGTHRGGVSRYTLPGSSEREEFLHYSIDQGLLGVDVMNIIEDKDNNIWFGTNAGACKYEPAKDGHKATFTHFTTAQGLPNNFIMVLLEDRAGNIWFGTGGGAVKYDGKSFTVFSKAQGLPDRDVNNIFEDRDGNIWFGTVTGGVAKFDGTRFTRFSETEGLPNNRINGLLQDNIGNMWIGTGQGISVYDDESLHILTENHGLVSKGIASILLDRSGNLWFGTGSGLSCLPASAALLDNVDSTITVSRNFMFRNYTYEDGFLGVSCGARTLLEAQDGTLWMSTSDRLTVYHPEHDFLDTVAPNIQLTGLELFNEHITWPILAAHRDSSILLGNGVTLARVRFDSLSKWHSLPVNLSLSHNNNFLTFRFVGVTTKQPQKVKYQYMLEGIDKYWSAPTSNNDAQYGSLPPGEYTFRVKAISGSGYWSDALSYPFKIRPPWWKTWWANTTYVVLFILLAFGIRRFEIRRLKDRSEAARLKELDDMKSKLYTNITHEFRTPLTVIMGMTDNIQGYEPERKLIRRNSTKLLKLINQMLDLSRVDSGKLKLDNRQSDIIVYLNYLLESFHSLAKEKTISLVFSAEEPSVTMDFDEEKLQHVIYNLLSNAIKFTGEQGEVALHVGKISAGKETLLQIKVKDTGSGIPAESLPYVFDRFYQVDASLTRTAEGSGIGLALAKEYVELMGGSISVESTLGVGSQFAFLLPITREAPMQTPASPAIIQVEAEATVHIPVAGLAITEEKPKEEMPILLIVEDNMDVVAYTRSVVERHYQVETAPNGKAGLEQAITIVPDIIISDVMMPEMDGYDLTHQLKNDERTSHIPVLLLTAKAGEEDMISGLRHGADAYLGKPFNKTELLLRLENLMRLRQAFQARYAHFQPLADQSTPPTLEDIFLEKVSGVVEENLSNGEFSVADFCRAIGMSQPQLYRKLMALTGKSPTHFIRSWRLKKAAALLKRNDLNISEVAWETGFNDPNYFSRVFQQEFGKTPSDWRSDL